MSKNSNLPHTGKSAHQVQSEPRTIYTSYRAALKAQKSLGVNRAAARKQNALKITADKYGKPISVVKSLVRDFDEANGIRHEHPAAYTEKLRVEALYKAYEAEHGDGPCQKCGTDQDSDLIRVRIESKQYAQTGEAEFSRMCLSCWMAGGNDFGR